MGIVVVFAGKVSLNCDDELAPRTPFLLQLYVMPLDGLAQLTRSVACPPALVSETVVNVVPFIVATQPVGAPAGGGVVLIGTQVSVVLPFESTVVVKLSHTLSNPTT
jgi:hypothetical protein